MLAYKAGAFVSHNKKKLLLKQFFKYQHLKVENHGFLAMGVNFRMCLTIIVFIFMK